MSALTIFSQVNGSNNMQGLRLDVTVQWKTTSKDINLCPPTHVLKHF
jgi:hypothetical protein